MNILKALGFCVVAVIVGMSLSEAGIEGNSSLHKAIFWWLLAFAAIGWFFSAMARTIRKRRGEPISRDTLSKRISDWLLGREPLVQLGYRIAIVLLLALGIDKIDRHTWGVANKSLRQLARIESRLSDIESHTSNIESHTSNIESNTDRLR